MPWSGQQFFHHACRLDAGKALVQTLVAEREPAMIEPQQLQDGRMEVADVHWVLGDVVRELVGLTDECFVRLSLVQCFRLRGCRPNSPAKDVVFVSARADATTAIDRPRRRERSVSGPTSRSVRASTSDFPWQTWLIRGSVALVLILTAIALLAPHGTWLVGCILMAIGGILVPVAYFAGAYGAFSEDTLYGLLYITIPLYTAYYLVTRWEDLWIWITCATVGVGLVLIGTEMVRWAGAAV